MLYPPNKDEVLQSPGSTSLNYQLPIVISSVELSVQTYNWSESRLKNYSRTCLPERYIVPLESFQPEESKFSFQKTNLKVTEHIVSVTSMYYSKGNMR